MSPLLPSFPRFCLPLKVHPSRVETSQDFTRLASQLSNITTGPNIPSESSVTVTDGACPTAENSTFQASETLPPTPDEAVCSCLYRTSFSCVVAEVTANKPDIVGALTEYVVGVPSLCPIHSSPSRPQLRMLSSRIIQRHGLVRPDRW